MRFERFPTKAALVARTVELLNAAKCQALDVGVYSDNAELSWRPQIIVESNGEVYVLRWYAFTDESVDFTKRRDAKGMADEIMGDIQNAW